MVESDVAKKANEKGETDVADEAGDCEQRGLENEFTINNLKIAIRKAGPALCN